MTRVGEQADVLRALGRFLDEQGADGIEIQTHEVYLGVTWEGSTADPGHKAYQEHELESLRAHARALRQPSGGGWSADHSFAELLRTLGQKLDDDGMEMNRVSQEGDGFRISGVSGGRYRTGLCFTAELIEMSAEKRKERGTGVSDEPVQEDPFLHVTMGAPVFTRDNQRLGKVREIQGRGFRVETGFLQKDFWLPATSVESAADGEPVLLTINKALVDDYKTFTPPATDTSQP